MQNSQKKLLFGITMTCATLVALLVFQNCGSKKFNGSSSEASLDAPLDENGQPYCREDQRLVSGICVNYNSTKDCNATALARYRADAKTSDDAKLTFSYCHFLGRMPEKEGYDFWLSSFSTYGRSYQFAGLFVGAGISWEKCKSKSSSNPTSPNSCNDSASVAVANMYNVALKRNGASSEISYWVNQWPNIGSNFRERAGNLGLNFANSPEFQSMYGDVF
ncbi:MAG: DUF4214 domain-containing protein [Bdellovibrionales bacterium]|nr:DUF4214 domain-containing protein [Bdellovibrionales bacterium]